MKSKTVLFKRQGMLCPKKLKWSDEHEIAFEINSITFSPEIIKQMMTMTKSGGPVENESVCIRILNVYLVDLSLLGLFRAKDCVKDNCD